MHFSAEWYLSYGLTAIFLRMRPRKHDQRLEKAKTAADKQSGMQVAQGCARGIQGAVAHLRSLLQGGFGVLQLLLRHSKGFALVGQLSVGPLLPPASLFLPVHQSCDALLVLPLQISKVLQSIAMPLSVHHPPGLCSFCICAV